MKKILWIIVAAAAAGAILVTSGISGKSRDEEPPVPVVLNDSLTNAVSSIPELSGMDSKIRSYMSQWQIKGSSLAIMRNDSLVYAKGYGFADDNRKMEPSNILRVASVSKLLTAVGIMVLQEKGGLSIKDKVFGHEGVLQDSLLNSMIKDSLYYRITVEHLLRHQAGFHRDPVFSSKDVKAQLGLKHAPELDDFARTVLPHALRYEPGTSQKYSNFGYMLLSRIIENVTGQEYEKWMRENVLEPAGCYDMHIAGNYYKDRRENEVRYYTHEGDGKFIEDYHGNGKIVERSYGGNNITVLSGAGAWTSSAAEMAKLVASIDGRPEVPDIISRESVEAMTEYFDQDTYSLGWNDTKPTGEWTRTGTYSGTSALVKYFPDGECWILINNSSTWKGAGLARYTNAMFQECREKYSPLLPKRTLFYK